MSKTTKKLLISINICILLTAGASTIAAEEKSRPNILFIAIDDMNDWTTVFDEDNPIQTPNLERLAKRGMFFSKAYCSVAACVPSRTAILSGLSPMSTGCYSNGGSPRVWNHKSNVVSLPQYFRDHGYQVQGAGKIFGDHWIHGGDDPRGTDYSWDDFQKFVDSDSPHLNGYTPDQVKPLSKRAFDWGEVARREQMGDEKMLDYVSRTMEEKWEKPMFLAAGIFKPHLPFYAPPEVFERYPMDDVVMPTMPENDLEDVPGRGRGMAHTEPWIYTNVIQHEAPDPRSLKRMVQCYQASADYADSVVGRLLDKLDASGKADNTIIILWSDHGYHLGDKESCVKFTLWEKANRVPLIIVAPGVTKPGTVCDAPVSLLDIYPTLAELGGLPPKADNDGHSLLPLLRNPQAGWEHFPIMTMGKGNHAIRTPAYRYIRYGDGSEELYSDEDEWNIDNLADDPEMKKVIERHRTLLDEQLSRGGAGVQGR